MSQARIKPKIFVNFRPEPDPTRKARPDLQLWLEIKLIIPLHKKLLC